MVTDEVNAIFAAYLHPILITLGLKMRGHKKRAKVIPLNLVTYQFLETVGDKSLFVKEY